MAVGLRCRHRGFWVGVEGGRRGAGSDEGTRRGVEA